jgi:DNA (cytosine-5)-methyltransferase 1
MRGKTALTNRKSVSPPDPEHTFVSFFSGALGLDIGFQCASLSPLAVNEIDRIACQTIRTNRPHLRLYDCDIRTLTPDTMLRDLRIEREQLFAVTGGPPCQAFSTAGRRLGLNDDRGNVFLHFIELVKGLRPKYAVFENVRGLLSAPLVHRPHDQRGRGHSPLTREESRGGALLHIVRLLEDAGYKVTFTLYNTANFGVPQVRERLIFFASRDGSEIPFISPTHHEFGLNGLGKWRTLKDAIAHLKGREYHAGKFPEARLDYYRMLKAGQNWRALPPEVQQKAMGGSWFAGGGKTGFYRRLSWNKPSPTLVTRPTMPATDLCHPDELRPLSVEEYAAIQTFPEDYVFCGKLDDQYRQVGNAVPCLFGAAIARHLIDFDKGIATTANLNGRMSRYMGTDHESWRESMCGLERQMALYD